MQFMASRGSRHAVQPMPQLCCLFQGNWGEVGQESSWPWPLQALKLAGLVNTTLLAQ